MSCSRPYFMKEVINPFTNAPLGIRCRTCECCRQDKLNELSSRADFELGRFNSASFVTFTYDDEHLPWVGSTHPTLSYEHFHKYLDSVRHRAKKQFPFHPFKYFHSSVNFTYIGCAEYGGKFERPHYHIIFFGIDPEECNDFLKTSWKYGSIDVQPLKKGGVNYVLKYINKQVFGELKQVLYLDKGCLPPKIFYSTGFGSGLYEKHAKELYEKGYISNGQKRIYANAYYTKKYRNLNTQSIAELDYDRWKSIKKRYDHYLQLGGYVTIDKWLYDQTLVREKRLQTSKMKRCAFYDIPIFDRIVPRKNEKLNPIVDGCLTRCIDYDSQGNYDPVPF